MRIEFYGTTNKDYCMINVAKIRLRTGSVLTIDRDETEYTIENGHISMLWKDCYLWAIDDVHISDEGFYFYGWPQDLEPLFEGAELVELELEDDADEDYCVTITEWGMG